MDESTQRPSKLSPQIHLFLRDREVRTAKAYPRHVLILNPFVPVVNGEEGTTVRTCTKLNPTDLVRS